MKKKERQNEKVYIYGLVSSRNHRIYQWVQNIQPGRNEKRNIYKKYQQNPKTDYRIISKDNDL